MLLLCTVYVFVFVCLSAGPGPHPHQPQPIESLEELDDRLLYGEPSPSLSDHAPPTSAGTYKYGGYDGSTKVYTAPHPVYSPPAGPGQHGSLFASVSPSKASPSKAFPGAGLNYPEPSPLRRVPSSEKEAELSREQLVESKMKLVEEVGQLRMQHDMLKQEIATMLNEKSRSREEMEVEFTQLQAEEYKLKVRIAQMQQNLGLMEDLSKQGRRMSDQSTEQERELRVCPVSPSSLKLWTSFPFHNSSPLCSSFFLLSLSVSVSPPFYLSFCLSIYLSLSLPPSLPSSLSSPPLPFLPAFPSPLSLSPFSFFPFSSHFFEAFHIEPWVPLSHFFYCYM